MKVNEFKAPEFIFSDRNYKHYLVEYQGTVGNEFEGIDGLYTTIINEKYAILSLRGGVINGAVNTANIIKFLAGYGRDTSIITYISTPELYTLQEISPSDAAQVNFLQINEPLDLNGKGVIIGIIDTGIDYLNEEFISEDGNTRIDFIWDQTIENKNVSNKEVPYGTIYNRNAIQEAINYYKSGGNPYDIVASKDVIGHGTNLAGIAGARGKNEKVKGVAYNCEFGVVKLVQAISLKDQYDIRVPVYNTTSILIAIEYLKEYAIRTGKPLVILLPLGTNSGNHRGNSILDEYISSVLNNVGIVVVTGAGNEGLEGGHTSGTVERTGNSEDIEIIVAPGEKNLTVEIWVDLPSIINANIISPSGEDTGLIPSILNSTEEYTFILERTTINLYYDIPEEISGYQLIRIYFYNIQQGTWKIRLTLRAGDNATFNIWTQQKGLKAPGTRFNPSDPYGTITVPGDSLDIITVAAYNQNNNNVINSSGMAFKDDFVDRIDVVAGGVNAVTVGLNNEIVAVSGTSVSASIVAGICALLLQWGIIEGNYPHMYSQSMKSFLDRGTTKRRGDIYPNPQWGYGIVNAYEIFRNIT